MKPKSKPIAPIRQLNNIKSNTYEQIDNIQREYKNKSNDNNVIIINNRSIKSIQTMNTQQIEQSNIYKDVYNDNNMNINVQPFQIHYCEQQQYKYINQQQYKQQYKYKYIKQQNNYNKNMNKYPPLPTNRTIKSNQNIQQNNHHQLLNKFIKVKSQFISLQSQLLNQILHQQQLQSQTQSSQNKYNQNNNNIQSQQLNINNHQNKYQQQTLYQRAKKSSIAKQAWISKQKKYFQYQILKTCTHSPNINPLSRQIAKRIRVKTQHYQQFKQNKHQFENNNQANINKYSSNKDNNKIKRYHSQQSQSCKKQYSSNKKRYNKCSNQLRKSSIQLKQQQQLKQCSFQPKINPISKKLLLNNKYHHLSNKSLLTNHNNNTIFQALYNDSKLRNINKKKKQIQSLNRQKFRKPSIDKLSKKIVGSTKFMKRIQNYQQQRVKKQISQEKENKIKQSNLYRPKVGRPPKKYNDQNLPIGQYLYQKGEQKSLKALSPNKNQPKVNQTSQKCYERQKRQCFTKIFQILDDNNDGAIRLNAQILQIMKPMLIQLQMMETQLNYEQFMISMQNLFQSLTINDRNTLLGNRKKTFVDDYSFQPNLNAKSKKIASQIQRDKINIYDFCTMKQIEKNIYLHEERLQKRKKQMQSCTFYPKIRHFRH